LRCSLPVPHGRPGKNSIPERFMRAAIVEAIFVTKASPPANSTPPANARCSGLAVGKFVELVLL
jgi:hypothetical protein